MIGLCFSEEKKNKNKFVFSNSKWKYAFMYNYRFTQILMWYITVYFLYFECRKCSKSTYKKSIKHYFKIFKGKVKVFLCISLIFKEDLQHALCLFRIWNLDFYVIKKNYCPFRNFILNSIEKVFDTFWFWTPRVLKIF